MDNKQFNELIDKAFNDDRFWQYVADEMGKRIGGSEDLGGKYTTDIAKKMFSALPKERIKELLEGFYNNP